MWTRVINSPLLPSAYDNSIVAPLPLVYDYGRVEPLIRGGGGAGVINSPLLPLAYDNSIVEPLIRGGGWVINSPLLPLGYDNRIVEPLMRRGVGWGD